MIYMLLTEWCPDVVGTSAETRLVNRVPALATARWTNVQSLIAVRPPTRHVDPFIGVTTSLVAKRQRVNMGLELHNICAARRARNSDFPVPRPWRHPIASVATKDSHAPQLARRSPSRLLAGSAQIGLLRSREGATPRNYRHPIKRELRFNHASKSAVRKKSRGLPRLREKPRLLMDRPRDPKLRGRPVSPDA